MGTALGEKSMAPWFDPSSPLKYTRLHLLGQKGAPVHTDWAFCKQWKYGFTDLYTTHETDADSEAVFPAIIEPYVGQPFIKSVALLPVQSNDAGAGRAIAIEVTTTNGHTDVVFADGRPEKVRECRVSSGEWRVAENPTLDPRLSTLRVSGEFAYLSADQAGLRQATLCGGTLLQTPEVTLKLARREYAARITRVDYESKTFETDAPLGPFAGSEYAIEVLSGSRPTTYMVTGVKPAGQGSAVNVRGGAELFASRVVEVDAKASMVYCALPLPFAVGGNHAGVRTERGLVASNADHKRFWRAEFLGGEEGSGRFAFKLDGPVAQSDFADPASLHVWEYGVGDIVRHPTWANLRRREDGAYELTANAELEVTLGNAPARQITMVELAKNNGAISLARSGK
jgi:hypothetical protein